MKSHCEKLIDGTCTIASEIAGVECRPCSNACEACQRSTNPMCRNIVTRGLAAATLIEQNEQQKAASILQETTRIEEAKRRRQPRCNAGTLLKQTIAQITGVKATKGCGCTSLAEQMDRNGIDWCRRNLKSVIVPAMVRNREMIAESLGISDLVIRSKVGEHLARLSAAQIVKYVLSNAVEE